MLAGLLMLYGSARLSGPHLTTEAWVVFCIAVALATLLWQQRMPVMRDISRPACGSGWRHLFKQTVCSVWRPSPPGMDVTVTGGARRRWLLLLAGCALPIMVVADFAAHGALDDRRRDSGLVNLTNYPFHPAHAADRQLVNLRAFPFAFGRSADIDFARRGAG